MSRPCLDFYPDPDHSDALGTVVLAMNQASDVEKRGLRLYVAISERNTFAGLRDFEDMVQIPYKGLTLQEKSGLIRATFRCLEGTDGYMTHMCQDILVEQMLYGGPVDRFDSGLGVLRAALRISQDPRFPKGNGLLMAEVWNKAQRRRPDLLYHLTQSGDTPANLLRVRPHDVRAHFETKWVLPDASIRSQDNMGQAAAYFRSSITDKGDLSMPHYCLPDNYQRFPDATQMMLDVFDTDTTPFMQGLGAVPGDISVMRQSLDYRLNTYDDFFIRVPVQ